MIKSTLEYEDWSWGSSTRAGTTSHQTSQHMPTHIHFRSRDASKETLSHRSWTSTDPSSPSLPRLLLGKSGHQRDVSNVSSDSERRCPQEGVPLATNAPSLFWRESGCKNGDVLMNLRPDSDGRCAQKAVPPLTNAPSPSSEESGLKRRDVSNPRPGSTRRCTQEVVPPPPGALLPASDGPSLHPFESLAIYFLSY